MRRRIADYDAALGIDTSQLLITIAGYLIGIAVLIAVYNFYISARRGAVAEANPWRSRSPEFLLPSPVPSHNYERPFEVVGEPYDYGLAGSVYASFTPVHQVVEGDVPAGAQPAAAD